MTDHSSHNHPATPAARRACRAAAAHLAVEPNANPSGNPAVDAANMRMLTDMYAHLPTWPVDNHTPSHVAGRHCQACGSTAYEDLELGDQGYTACCNEPVVGSCDPTYCYHK